MSNYYKMATAYVLINCDHGKEQSTVESLKHLASVKEIHNTLGAYDIVAKLEHDEGDKLKEMISRGIRKMDCIRSTLTLIPVEGQS
ncbi:transcription regulator [Candidatus Nitrosarchaeum limnium SFB1]|uniref:Transcription regulator n=1 Tax=Candidatus Nitrosarchaeum limnium SFB1 TaxID=886738 RepID=F3KK30_9ARCH|nr:transcription regulator [Candidatus Nitrosarchaeum limnium SFB1]